MNTDRYETDPEYRREADRASSEHLCMFGNDHKNYCGAKGVKHVWLNKPKTLTINCQEHFKWHCDRGMVDFAHNLNYPCALPGSTWCFREDESSYCEIEGLTSLVMEIKEAAPREIHEGEKILVVI